MISENAILHTTLATMQRPTPELVELRFKAGQRITLAGILEIYGQLDRYNWAGPGQFLVVFPDEPVVFDFGAMMADHIQGRPASHSTHRIAIAVGDPSNMPLFQQYFATFHSEITIRLFLHEDEARAWLAETAATS